MNPDKKHKGIVVPAVTPLTREFKLDELSVERIFLHFRLNQVSPFILGTTGESPLLSTKLKEHYINFASSLKRKIDGLLYVGVASTCVDESIDLIAVCADNKVDGIVVTLPSYYELSEHQMEKYFERLADVSTVPLILYNIPATIHQSIPLHVIDTLSYHENIVAIKDSERDDERLRDSIALWSHRADFSYFLGWAARSAEALIMGADGVVPSSGNLNPTVYHDLYEAVLKGDHERARELQRESDYLGNLYQSGRTLGESLWALKTLMSEKGLCSSYVMPPLSPMSAEERRSIVGNLNEYLKVKE